MELITKIGIDTPVFKIDYRTKLMLLGSCFAEHIGEKFGRYKFQAEVNPFGIVYNPLAMASVLERLAAGNPFSADELLQVGDKWVSLLHHGSFSEREQTACLEKINRRFRQASEMLSEADLLVMTWGTAWVYRYRKQGKVVSNCHKIPACEYDRFRLSVPEITACYTSLIRELRKFNPGLRILFTVSPIRHWKDGAHGNQLSKATLLLAIEELTKKLDQVYYFPSYEIVLDELRDYRYYAPDMLHLSGLAVDYIWERFGEYYFEPGTFEIMGRIERLHRGLEHRPFDSGSENYKKHIERLERELEQLSSEYPFFSLEAEKEMLALRAKE